MATWIGTLARGGLIREPREEAGIAVAAFVVGEQALSSLRKWVASQPPDIVEREQRAAVEVCIWMAHADRDVAHEEAELLRAMVLSSDLGPVARGELLAEVGEPPGLRDIADRLTHPVLRELMLALSWELPFDVGNENQGDTLGFDLGIYTEQERHNDGAGPSAAA